MRKSLCVQAKGKHESTRELSTDFDLVFDAAQDSGRADLLVDALKLDFECAFVHFIHVATNNTDLSLLNNNNHLYSDEVREVLKL